MRWKDKSNTTVNNLAGDDVFPLTDVSTDQDKKATINVIAGWVVTVFTTSVAGATQTIVDAINAVRTMAQNAATAAATAQSGVDANAAAIQEANSDIATNTQNITTNRHDIDELSQTMESTNEHVDELESQVDTMEGRVEAAITQAEAASTQAAEAADAATDAAETVQEIIDQGGMVASVFGRGGIVTAQTGDYTSDQILHGAETVADLLAFDASPTENSSQAVQSGGVYDALSNKVSKDGDVMDGRIYFNDDDFPPVEQTNYKKEFIAFGNYDEYTPEFQQYGSICLLKNETETGLYISGGPFMEEATIFIGGKSGAGYISLGGALDISLDSDLHIRFDDPEIWRKALGANSKNIGSYSNPFTFYNGCTEYSYGGDDEPYAIRMGRVVQLGGAFKFADTAQASAAGIHVATLHPDYRPAKAIRCVQQASGQNRFLLRIGTDGKMYVDRYGVATHIPIPAGAWLNIFCTYLTDNNDEMYD